MRRLIALLLSAGALVSFATSVDAATKKKRVYKAPPMVTKAVAPSNFPSFYAGVHGGYGWGRFSAADDAQTLSTRGMLGGAQIGLNYQINKFVVGGESDFSLASVLGRVRDDLGGAPITGVARHLWFATFAARFGYTENRTMAYLKGGAALTRYKWAFDSLAGGTAFSATTRLGWMVGAGVEHAMTDAVSAKIEYNYMDFGTLT